MENQFVWHTKYKIPGLEKTREPNLRLVALINNRRVIDLHGHMWMYQIGEYGKPLSWLRMGQILNGIKRSDPKSSRFNKWEMNLNK